MSENRDSFDELCIQSPNGDSLLALINGKRGFLVIMNSENGSSRTSRNPDYSDDNDSTIEYQLSNGQVDEYPESWALPIELIRQALSDFEQNHTIPTYITWHIDD
ncbi:Imm1 family immunity protein [Algisphaera agarilytica]|uniref:Immunity protein Imm1 n=1 Tax=Algisphaera agarilytica TaxID=1385975 RepID=A0A7X0LLH6_9BACT|nr:Imm1 family immunity protein [Algisphaera agarilytica]MBB6430919.1 hypothetical protein [Algisphaera agarilytica]